MTDPAVFYNYIWFVKAFINYEKTSPSGALTFQSKSETGFGREKT